MYQTKHNNNILLIEDNDLDCTLVKNTLLQSNSIFNINVFNEGTEAMMYLKKEGKYTKAQRPDLIILDLNLPKLNGYDVLTYVKSNKTTKCIPVVVLTMSEMLYDVDKSYLNHANCFITKPANFEEFIKILNILKKFWLNVVKLPPNLEINE